MGVWLLSLTLLGGLEASPYLSVPLEVLRSPLEWRAGERWAFVGTAAFTGALMLWADEPVRALREEAAPLGPFLSLGEAFGDYPGRVLPFAFLLGYGLWTREVFHQASAFYLLGALGVAGVWVTGLKVLTGRARPDVGEGPHRFRPPGLSSAYRSFPSGHTISAFTVAAFLSERYRRQELSWVLYTLASFTAIQRIYADRHWLSDVFFGAVSGIYIGRLTARLSLAAP